MLSKKDYNKKYYETNKDKILQSMARIITCDNCYCEVSFCKLNRHKKSKCCKNHYLSETIKLLKEQLI